MKYIRKPLFSSKPSSMVNGQWSTVGRRPGYMFLVSVLFIGAIATATSVSLMLLGWAAQQNGQLVAQSTQAFEYAQTCAERTLRNLRYDPAYAGSGTITLSDGSCAVRSVTGQGNDTRVICSTGYSGQNTRRLEVVVSRLYPSVIVQSWREVSSFSLCL